MKETKDIRALMMRARHQGLERPSNLPCLESMTNPVDSTYTPFAARAEGQIGAVAGRHWCSRTLRYMWGGTLVTPLPKDSQNRRALVSRPAVLSPLERGQVLHPRGYLLAR